MGRRVAHLLARQPKYSPLYGRRAGKTRVRVRSALSRNKKNNRSRLSLTVLVPPFRVSYREVVVLLLIIIACHSA